MLKRPSFLNLPSVTIVILACSVVAQSFAFESSAIKRDPFQRPHDAASMGAEKPSLHSGQGIQEGEGAGSHGARLRAIIFDPKKPLVNIGGQIIELGGTLHGYTLVKVDEREATLVKNGRPIKLSIDGAAGQ